MKINGVEHNSLRTWNWTLCIGYVCGLGSNGASVMLGRVSKILTDKVPFWVCNHCIAHRLARTYSKAANELVYLKKIQRDIKLKKEKKKNSNK